jgi:hypothetical protein
VRLPNRHQSNAVVVGTSVYRAPAIENLPAVRNNVRDLVALLTDRRHGILPPERCSAILDPVGTREVYRVIREHANAATDTLLVYFAGHGETDEQLRLHLCMTDTDLDELAVSALSFDHVRELLHHSPADNKIVILDCCFSGRAIHGMGQTDTAAAGAIAVEGSYVLTATANNDRAMAPPGRAHTAFTGELIRLVRDGVPDGPSMLTVHTLYRKLRHTLPAKGFPQPASRRTGTAELVVLCRNRWTNVKQSSAPVLEKAPTAETSNKPKANKKAKSATPAYVPLPQLKFCHNGATLISTGRDRVLRVWDVSSRRLRHEFTGHSDIVAHCAVGQNETVLATAGRDRKIRLWDLHHGRSLGQIDTPARWVAFSPDQMLLAGVTKDPMVDLWDLRTMTLARRIRGHVGGTLRASFSPDGAELLTTGRDKSLRIWSVLSGKQRLVLPGIESPRHAAFNAAGGWLATALPQGGVRLRSLASGQQIGDVPGEPAGVAELAASSDGRLLAMLRSDGRIALYDLATQQALLRLPVDGATPVSRIVPGPDQMLAVLANDGLVCIRDVATGKVLHTLPDPCSAPPWFAFSPDGRHAATGSRDGTVHLHDLVSRETIPLRRTIVTRPTLEPVAHETPATFGGRLRSAYAQFRNGLVGPR